MTVTTHPDERLVVVLTVLYEHERDGRVIADIPQVPGLGRLVAEDGDPPTNSGRTTWRQPTLEETMKRRFFALLAVPALALGFALAPPATDQAHAYMPLSPDTVCAIARSQIHIAHDGGDDGAADVFYGNAVAYGCNEWDLV